MTVQEVGVAAQQLASCRDPQQLLACFSQLLQSGLPHQAGSVWLSSSQPELSWGVSFEAFRLVDGLREPRLLTGAWEQGLVSALAVPLACGVELQGAVLLASRQPFQPAQLDLLALLGQVLALALGQTRLRSTLVECNKLAAVGQMAAGVAHELNSPLAALMLSVQSAANQLSVNPTKVGPRLDRALQAAEKARTIAEKLVAHARRSTPKLEWCQLPALIQDALEVFGGSWRFQGASIALEVEPVPALQGSFQELQQVLINLVQNAIHATQGGSDRRIVIGCRRVGREVVLSVSDHGQGIAPEDQERIFQAFFTTKPRGQGTGLGLSVCQEIAQQHGGRLEVSSTLGQGSTFRLCLPLPVESPKAYGGPREAPP